MRKRHTAIGIIVLHKIAFRNTLSFSFSFVKREDKSLGINKFSMLRVEDIEGL